MNEIQLAWLAGIIDGEGSIMLSRQRDGTMNVGLVVTNTNVEILNQVEKIYNEIGVNPHWYQKKNYKNNHSVSYNLDVNRLRDILVIIKSILPYLVGKKAQAETFIRYAERRIKAMGTSKSGTSTVDLRDAKYDALTELESDVMKSLNQRSKSSETIRQMVL